MLIAGVTFVACGEDTTEPPPPTVASVIVSPPAATLSGVGVTQAFTAEALDTDGNVLPFTSVTWTSENPAIATVGESGVATVVASGQVTLTASIDGTPGHTLMTTSVPDVTPVTSWTVEAAPDLLYSDLYDIWGTSSTDIYAAGYGWDENGEVVHYDGAEWSGVNDRWCGGGWRRAPGRGSVETVWGTSSSNIYIVSGEGRAVLHYDGTCWTDMTDGTWVEWTSGLSHTFRDVWGTSSSDLYAVGYYDLRPSEGGRVTAGAILHFDGTGWSDMAAGTADWLSAVWGTSSRDIYAVGEYGTILHYDGGDWDRKTSGVEYPHLDAVWGTATDDIFALGYDGTILHYDGSDWSEQTSGTSNWLRGVWGTSSTDVYAVGSGGTILHYDGSDWSEMASGTTESLYAVWGLSSSDVYVVGDNGTVLRGTR